MVFAVAGRATYYAQGGTRGAMCGADGEVGGTAPLGTEGAGGELGGISAQGAEVDGADDKNTGVSQDFHII